MRANATVHLKELWSSPAPDQTPPFVRFVAISGRTRRVLRGLYQQYNALLQAIFDEDPELHQRMRELVRDEAMAARERLRQQQARSAPPTQPDDAADLEAQGLVTDGADPAASLEGSEEASSKALAVKREVEQELEGLETLAEEPQLNAIYALQARLAGERAKLHLRELVTCIHSIGGDWSLIDPTLDPHPVWPPIDPDDPEPAIGARCALLEELPEGDLGLLVGALATFQKQGGAGADKSTAKN